MTLPLHPIAPSYFIDPVGCVADPLARGIDPQAVLDALVEEAVSYHSINAKKFTASLDVLLAHGVRVATDQPGCALEKLITRPTNPHPLLIYELANNLAGRPGELPYHVLARHCRRPLGDRVLAQPGVRAGLCARDPSGRTVSHWLWDDQTSIIRQAGHVWRRSQKPSDRDRANDLWRAALLRAWAVQAQVQALGAGLEVPDHEGITAFELCARRIKAGHVLLFPEFAICRHFQSLQDNHTMQSSTLPAQPAGINTTPRL